jgi:hypothetical protein
MIKSDARFAAIAFFAATLAGCQTPQPVASSVDVHATMVERIDPAAVVIWSISSRAMSEASGSRQTRMNEAAWRKLEASAQQLTLAAGRLAEASAIRVGAHNDELEGFADGAEIQARIDADPAEFRRLARDAAEHAEKLAAAAHGRDIVQSQTLTKSLYDNCRACHSRYWEAQPR